ncbi:MAG: protein kinase [Bryobacteraceae bacterium]
MLGPGTRLNEYEIVSPLGKGGMGEVFLARDTVLDRLAALKILRWETEADAERVKRFATEAKAAAALSHPNLAAIYGVGQCGQVCFIAMEYVKGQTLREAGLDQPALIDAILQAAAALEAAHAAGIIHRDIKPSNIMRTETGLVKVLDFGLAKRMKSDPDAGSGLTQSGMVMGTLGYMSPEQLLGRALDHRTDVFSLGVVMYELLTGKLPFEAGSYEGALAELSGVTALAPEPMPAAPPAVAAAVMRCLARDPEKRFPSAAAFAQALREKPEAPTPPPPPRSSSRREWMLAGAATAAVAGVAALKFMPGPPGPIDSLAVLPFAAGTVDSTLDYLREGIAEGLMNRLAGIAGLRVISRDSAFRHRSQTAREAGRVLGVRAVVAGAIHKVEDALLVSAELVDSSSDQRMWGEEFRCQQEDVLSTRDRIAEKIAEQLRSQLTGNAAAPAASPKKAETSDARAHDLYMRGRFLANRLSESEVRQGLEYLERAIELDPDFAHAHAAAAEARLFLADLFQPAPELLAAARRTINRALEINPLLADAHVALAMVKMQDEYDWPGAEQALRRALTLDPHLLLAHGFLGWLLAATGKRQEGMAANRRATELEPRSPLAHAMLAANFYFARQYGDSFSSAGSALEIDPQFPLALYWRGLSMVARGFPSLVISKIEPIAASNPVPPVLAVLGRARAASGRIALARESLAALTELSRSKHVSAILFAGLHAALHDKEAALNSLERAYETRARLLLWIHADPVYDNLRAEPRFQALVTKLRLPSLAA